MIFYPFFLKWILGRLWISMNDTFGKNLIWILMGIGIWGYPRANISGKIWVYPIYILSMV